MVLSLLPPRALQAAPPGSDPLSWPAQADAAIGTQALYLYNEDDDTANAVGALLGDNGVALSTLRLREPTDSTPAPTDEPTAEPTAQPTTPPTGDNVFLPLVASGASGVRTASQPAAPQVTRQAMELSRFDVILLADDLYTDGAWRVDEELTRQLLASERPVIGFGRGGAHFFDLAGTGIGLSNAVEASGAQVENAEGNANLAFFGQPNALDSDGPLALYESEQAALVVPLSERQPDVRRLAQLAGQDGQIAILTQGERFALWGFYGGPDAMTETGRALLVNLVNLLTAEQVEIPLAGVTLKPEPGIEPALVEALRTGEPQYALVQLYDLPELEERELLARLGVDLLSYLTGNVYSAQLRPELDPNSEALLDLLRFAGGYQPSYKIDPDLQAEPQEGEVVFEEAHVIFFDNVSAETIREVLNRVAGERYRQAAVPTEWFVPNEPAIVDALAQEPSVRFIAPLAPPSLLNDTAHPFVNTDSVQNVVMNGGSAQYLGLSGQGVTVAQFEDQPDNAHPDLSGRIVLGGQASGANSSHATHVAGIIVGNGADSANNSGSAFQWRGHAPEARLVSEDFGNDFPSFTTAYADNWYDAIVTNGAEASNHSYVQTYGTYVASASIVDQIVRGDAVDSNGNPVPARSAMWAVGNNGTTAQNGGNEEGFYSIYSPSKNSINVGSTDTTDGAPSDFSSRGPTFDGRIKPDVVAPGCQDSLVSPSDGIQSPENGGGYTTKCGTSMAAPVVTGITALMFEQFGYTFTSFDPLPSTVKALLVNTAVDQTGTSAFTDPDCNCTFEYEAGPDWTTGYGMVDAEAAVAAVRSKSFLEDEVSPTNTVDEFTIEVTADLPQLRFTLAWDDEAGDTSTSETTAKLVNDLDLVLIAPNSAQTLPWVLDALPLTATPGNGALDPISQSDINDNPAYRAVNTRDNVEQVLVNNPMAGTWTIRVTASALPNANTQPYSLAGDFRTVNIVDPQTGDVAEAGDPSNPNVVLVKVEATQPYAADTSSSLVDAVAADFEVEIEGTSASVINGLPVGDQFWLNVLPQSGVYSAGSKYDLTVRWLGHGQDSETNAVLFTEREQTDRAIVLDHSGSMSDYDKMAAVQNAARLFIDQSLVDDRIAVVGFSTNASTPYPSTAVSANPGNPELEAAKDEVDAFSPTNRTAIGKGLLAGQTEVTANASEVDVIVLLSDGMENEDPRYDTPAVKGVIEPTDTIVHTVSVGPPSAGHHGLMEEIADDNGGEDYVVTEDASVAAASLTAAAAAQTGIDAWPQRLPNRMGDSYKQIAEEILDEHRLFQASGLADPKAGAERWEINVPDGLERITFAVNWSVYGHQLRLIAVSPDGKEYAYDQSNPLCRTDPTHETCIIEKPLPGRWLLVVQFVETNPENEFIVWASARTSVHFELEVATSPAPMGEPVHLLGFLSQRERPLPGQKVVVNVYNMSYSGLTQLELLDDGQHGDGQPEDGIYGGYYTAGEAAGGYAVRGVAAGNDATGAPFELYVNTNFRLQPRVLYVHADDRETAQSYERLIEVNGAAVDLVPVRDVPSVNLRQYGLVLIGPDTGRLDEWGTDEAVRHIVEFERPVLGLGEGGYAFFGRLGLNIGWGNGAHGTGTSIQTANLQDSIWTYPYDIDLTERKVVQLYEEETGVVGIFLGDAPNNVQVFGYDPQDERYAEVIMESNFWTLWSFQDGPERMTQDGRDFFINTVYRTMP